jgi:hypothetical protein
MADYVKGDVVVILDRPLGHPSKIRGVVIGFSSEDTYNILILNGMRKGDVKKFKSFEIDTIKELYND